MGRSRIWRITQVVTVTTRCRVLSAPAWRGYLVWLVVRSARTRATRPGAVGGWSVSGGPACRGSVRCWRTVAGRGVERDHDRFRSALRLGSRGTGVRAGQWICRGDAEMVS